MYEVKFSSLPPRQFLLIQRMGLYSFKCVCALKAEMNKQEKKEMGVSCHIGIVWKLGFFT